MCQSAQRFNRDPHRDAHQRDRIQKGSQHSRSLIAEGLLVGRRPRLEVDRYKGEQERAGIGNIVPGFGDQGEGMRPYAGNEGQDYVG